MFIKGGHKPPLFKYIWPIKIIHCIKSRRSISRTSKPTWAAISRLSFFIEPLEGKESNQCPTTYSKVIKYQCPILCKDPYDPLKITTRYRYDTLFDLDKPEVFVNPSWYKPILGEKGTFTGFSSFGSASCRRGRLLA